MQPKHLMHTNGGTIKEISGIGHESHKGVADWFYLCNVDWMDGTKSVNLHVAPWGICYDHEEGLAKIEYTFIETTLVQYLNSAGTWHEPKEKRGMRYSWTPHKKNGLNVAIKTMDAPT